MADPDVVVTVKVIVTGAWGAGKTTFVSTLSDISVLTTERHISLDDDVDDPTKVAMDFGCMTVEDDLELHLFGASGHPTLSAVVDILGDGVIGAIVLIDDRRPDAYDEAAAMVDELVALGVPHVLAVNKAPVGREDLATKRVRHQLRLPAAARVLVGDARTGSWARTVLVDLLETARETVDAGAGVTTRS